MNIVEIDSADTQIRDVGRVFFAKNKTSLMWIFSTSRGKSYYIQLSVKKPWLVPMFVRRLHCTIFGWLFVYVGTMF